jgi:hypothetical protein
MVISGDDSFCSCGRNWLWHYVARVVSGECQWSHITMADGTSLQLGSTILLMSVWSVNVCHPFHRAEGASLQNIRFELLEKWMLIEVKMSGEGTGKLVQLFFTFHVFSMGQFLRFLALALWHRRHTSRLKTETGKFEMIQTYTKICRSRQILISLISVECPSHQTGSSWLLPGT